MATPFFPFMRKAVKDMSQAEASKEGFQNKINKNPST